MISDWCLSRPWLRYPLKQLTWANGSPAILAWLPGNQHRTKRGPLHVVTERCMTGANWGATGSETRIYPYCLIWLLETISLEGYLAHPGYIGEGLGPAAKQCARLWWLPMGNLTLSVERMRVWRGKVEGAWGGEGVGILTGT